MKSKSTRFFKRGIMLSLHGRVLADIDHGTTKPYRNCLEMNRRSSHEDTCCSPHAVCHLSGGWRRVVARRTGAGAGMGAGARPMGAWAGAGSVEDAATAGASARIAVY